MIKERQRQKRIKCKVRKSKVKTKVKFRETNAEKIMRWEGKVENNNKKKHPPSILHFDHYNGMNVTSSHG